MPESKEVFEVGSIIVVTAIMLILVIIGGIAGCQYERRNGKFSFGEAQKRGYAQYNIQTGDEKWIEPVYTKEK